MAKINHALPSWAAQHPNRPSNAQAWLSITKISQQTPWQPRQLGRERERVHKLKIKKIIWKAKKLFGLAVSVTQFSVFITHYSKMVGPMTKRLFSKR